MVVVISSSSRRSSNSGKRSISGSVIRAEQPILFISKGKRHKDGQSALLQKAEAAAALVVSDKEDDDIFVG